MSKELPFNPIFLLKGARPQTIMGSLPNLFRSPTSKTKYIILPDKDYLALEVSTPINWKPSDPTVVMIHGLCGSHKSACLVRLAKKFKNKRIRAIRVNLRGCGTGKGRAKKVYHGGQSSDIFEVLKVLKSESPASDITLIGFSLGGNIALKLAGELGMNNLQMLRGVIAINPPVDLYASVKLLAHPKNRMYEKYFVKLIKADINYRYKIFKDLKKVDFPDNMSFLDFNRLYTVPEYGFKDPIEYYKRSSSKYYVPAIDIACKILFAEDDPLINPNSFQNMTLPENISVYKTKRGGHIGYITFPTKEKRGIYWIDNVILDWVDNM